MSLPFRSYSSSQALELEVLLDCDPGSTEALGLTGAEGTLEDELGSASTEGDELDSLAVRLF